MIFLSRKKLYSDNKITLDQSLFPPSGGAERWRSHSLI